jgi:hypothetical protein
VVDPVTPGDEHGRGRVVHDLGGDRTQQHRLDRAVAAAPEDDQVGIHRIGLVDDRRRRTTLEYHAFDGETRLLEPLARIDHDPFGRRAELGFELGGVDQREARPGTAELRDADLDHLRHPDGRPVGPGDVGNEIDGAAGLGRPVDRHQDTHVVTLDHSPGR